MLGWTVLCGAHLLKPPAPHCESQTALMDGVNKPLGSTAHHTPHIHVFTRTRTHARTHSQCLLTHMHTAACYFMVHKDAVTTDIVIHISNRISSALHISFKLIFSQMRERTYTDTHLTGNIAAGVQLFVTHVFEGLYRE